MHTTQLDMERWNGHIPPLIYSMQKRLLGESRAESLTPQKNTGALGENGGDAVARQTLPPPCRSLHLTSEEYTSRGACTSTLPPGTSGSRQGLGSRRPHSLAPSSEATSLSLPPTARAPKGQHNALAPGGKGGERCCAHHSSTHSCGETSIPSGAPLPSTGRNHGDPPAPGGSALALSIR